MNKKSLSIIVFIGLFLLTPVLEGKATIPPEDYTKISHYSKINPEPNLATIDTLYNFDGNTINIEQLSPQKTRILLNDTYRIDLNHNETNININCVELSNGGTTPQDITNLFNVDFSNTDQGLKIIIEVPTFKIELSQYQSEGDKWSAIVNNDIEITFNSTSKEFDFSISEHGVNYNGEFIIAGMNSNSSKAVTFIVNNETSYMLYTASYGHYNINFNEIADILYINNFFVGLVYDGPIPSNPTFLQFDPIIITFIRNDIIFEWKDVSIVINKEAITIVILSLVITWYLNSALQRIVVTLQNLTVILYLAVLDLLLVIIYDSFELKIYEEKFVLIYQYLEIILLFINLSLWQISIHLNFEFWVVQLIFTINVIAKIFLLPFRVTFIPGIFPVFLPTIYYVPILQTEYLHIYLPYASPQMFIEVKYQQLGFPNHNIQYKVYDAAGNSVNDATVAVDYNGTNYPATFLAAGVYEIEIPASTEPKTVMVTAEKPWYPTAELSYTLFIDWIIETKNVTETVTSSFAFSFTVFAIFTVLIGTLVFQRKSKK